MYPLFSRTLTILKISFKERPSPLAISTLLNPSEKSAKNSRMSSPFSSAGALYFSIEFLGLLTLIKFWLLIIRLLKWREPGSQKTRLCLGSEVSSLNHDFSGLLPCRILNFPGTYFLHDRALKLKPENIRNLYPIGNQHEKGAQIISSVKLHFKFL